ncbi:MAG: ATP-binding protein [Acidobacteria bacterium]|nr:ATP-binding protein [Acidobacteriota bacterium]
MAADPWHFERSDFTSRVLTLLVGGPGQALTLFAPRRTGKTEFLLKDLAPLAEARGHRVVYASFWQAPLSPLAVLLHALETSLRRGTLRDRLRSSASALAPKLKLSAPATGMEATLDLTAVRGTPPADLLLHMDDLLDRLSRRRKTTILLLDEVQELARTRDNAPLVAALRTSLDTRGRRLRTVFTGSSRERLAAMFSARQAPFFHFATPIELPPLAEAFVDHILATFGRVSQRTLNRGDALAAFEQLHANPHFFRVLIEQLLHDPELAIKPTLAAVRERIALDLGYPETWLALTAIQRATARALAAGADQPFGQPFRRRVGGEIGETAVSAGHIQAALRRLERAGLADTHTGRWALADPEFAAWVREHDGESR